jgi:hypothetical protein
MILAVEDTLSEIVLRRLVSLHGRFPPTVVVGLKGNAYLRMKARELNRSALSVRVLLVTDLNHSYRCPADLIEDWLGNTARNMTFRVAVTEIESWLLGDRHNFANLLGVPVERIPTLPDDVRDPKQFIVNLARKSRRRSVRDDFVPATGSTATVGPAFAARLAAFSASTWEPGQAAVQSHSLRRAIRRIAEM